MRHQAEKARLSQRATPTLLSVLFALTLALAGCAGAAPAAHRTAGASPSLAFEPRLSPTDHKYIDAAWRATVARDPACNGTHGQELTTGSPSRVLTTMFAILLRPATRANHLQAFLHDKNAYGPLATVGDFNQELYLNQIRLARTAFGARFYVIPAGNVTGQRGVPARCGPEQVATLTRQLSRVPPGRRGGTLAAQAGYLAYLRYQALHPEGICATFVPPHAAALDLADNLGCATPADIQRWGVLADASAYLGGHVGVFWTVVPDRVGTVTLRFTAPNGGAIATSTVLPVNNLIVAREPWDAPHQSGFPSAIVLRAADGSVIKQIVVTPNMLTLCGYGC